MKNLKGIIFDLDGTLADTLPLCLKSFRLALEEVTGIKYAEREITKYFGQTEEGITKTLVPDNHKECLDAYIKFYKENHHLCPSMFDGISEMLEFLKKNRYKTALVTGKGEHSVYITLDYYGIRDYFEYVETGSTNGIIKDKCIKRILDKWQLPANQTVYIGDQPSDMIHSKKAGVFPVAVTWASTTDTELLKKENPYKLFSKPKDFNDWLKLMTADACPKT